MINSYTGRGALIISTLLFVGWTILMGLLFFLGTKL